MSIQFSDEPVDPAPPVMGGRNMDDLERELPDNVSGFSSFERLDAETAPDIDDAGLGVISGDPLSTPQEKKKKKLQMTREMKKAMKKLKERIGKFPALWFATKAEKHPEWRLNQEEEEIISESIGFVMEILDIEFMIEPINVTLTSIWWIIAYPFCTIGLIWFSHHDAVKLAHPEEFEEKEK